MATRFAAREVLVLATEVADLEIKRGVSGMHVVYGQQHNNMSTRTIFSMRAISFISSLLMSSDLHFHYYDDLAAHQF